MKPIIKFKILFAALFLALGTQSILAQSRADIFDGKTPITWLGLDYTQAKFIISPSDEKSKEELNADFTGKYIPAWNYLFMMEKKKFDVAKAVHRSEVKYALSVTEKVNNTITKDFYSTNQKEYQTLTEGNIRDLVKSYDFQGNKGIGMMFFVEGMNKLTGEEGVWVTFVDMDSKNLLFTSYLTGKIAGMGFRNNWANPFYKILLQVGSYYDQWAK